jgi:hypothetical protein
MRSMSDMSRGRGGINVSKQKNPNYTIRVRDTGSGFDLTADISEQTNISIAAEYVNRTVSSTTEIGGPLGGVANFANFNALSPYGTNQIWTGSSPVEFPITILFDAYKDAYKEVWEPMSLLETLVMPVGYSFAFDQIKTMTSPAGNGDISIHIGKMFIPKVVVVSVSSTYDNRLSKEGYPISGQAEVSFRTYSVVDKNQWKSIKGIM